MRTFIYQEMNERAYKRQGDHKEQDKISHIFMDVNLRVI